MSTGALTLEPDNESHTSPLVETMSNTPLWLFQTIAAFPRRSEPAPVVVYAVWIVLFGALLVVGLRHAPNRVRWALVVSITVAAITPIALTIATITQTGAIWQGRYGLPYSVGVPLIAAVALDRSRSRHVNDKYALTIVAIGVVVAHAISAQNVFVTEQRTSPLAGDPSWFVINPWAPCMAMMLGGVVWLFGVMHGQVPGRSTGINAADDGPQSLATEEYHTNAQ
jgi:hypothetical protein